MANRALTARDLWALPRVGTPSPAPDGSFVVVPVTTYDVESDQGTTRLYRVDSDGSEARPLTSPEFSSSSPAVSPDGTKLAFVRKPVGEKSGAGRKAEGASGPRHADKSQLFVMPLDGGEAERVTDVPLGAGCPVWFPDGSRIAFLSKVYRDAPTLEETAEKAKDIKERKVTAHVTEDRVYRYWDRWLTDGDVHHVFVLHLRSSELTDVTPTSKRWLPFMSQEGHLAVSPEGDELAFTAVRSNPPYDPMIQGVFVVTLPQPPGNEPAAPGAADSESNGVSLPEPRLLDPTHPAHAFRPLYSPDGRWLIYGIQRQLDFYGDRQRIVAYDRRAKTHTVLTEQWDVNGASDWTFGDDPNELIFTAEVESRNAVFSLDVAAAASDPEGNQPLQRLRGGWLSRPQVARGQVFTTLQSLLAPPEVVSFDLGSGKLRQLTSFTKPLLADIELGAVEEIVFEGAEGDSVQMYVVHPPAVSHSDEDGPPPLVHMVHGGPHGCFGDQWHWRWSAQAFAAPGYLVALVNFHGSTGWGEDFTASILGRWGDQPYEDVMLATDVLIERGMVDPERMAVTGGSYGGYLVSWIASQTSRFNCIVNHAGVCDFQPQYASDVTQGRRRSMGGELWDRLDGLDKYNPLRHASGFSSPMLVIHGERDYRVPYVQGLEIYNVYKAMGLPARLVCYPDENHWILKPQNSLHWYSEVLTWLRRWLRPDTPDAEALPEQRS